jgi:predicted nucleic acid-binding protein
MTAPNSVLLDTYALLAYLNDEPGARQVGRLLKLVEDGRMEGYVCCISVTELLSRLGSVDIRRTYDFIAHLHALRLQMLPIGLAEAEHAGNLKLKYHHLKLSTADALIIASAMFADIDLVVTGDDEWKHIEEMRVLEI